MPEGLEFGETLQIAIGSIILHGIMAIKPVLREGKNLTINSLWEQGLNADYDGDGIQIHLPVFVVTLMSNVISLVLYWDITL